jgi:hypothetical protein
MEKIHKRRCFLCRHTVIVKPNAIRGRKAQKFCSAQCRNRWAYLKTRNFAGSRAGRLVAAADAACTRRIFAVRAAGVIRWRAAAGFTFAFIIPCANRNFRVAALYVYACPYCNRTPRPHGRLMDA